MNHDLVDPDDVVIFITAAGYFPALLGRGHTPIAIHTVDQILWQWGQER